MNTIALSIDVEPWWVGDLPRKDYNGHEDIVVPAVERLLDLLDEKAGRATFFILGEVAEKNPALVRAIAARGHEIGSHGYGHISLGDVSREEFVRSEKKAIDILASICGERPLGFRAANCSAGRDTPWFHDALEELGYTYSSSVFPMRTPLYGYPGAPLHPYHPNGYHGDGAGGLVEFPFTIYRGPFLKIPACGGVYLRFQPLWLLTYMLRKVLAERPAVIYIHPRDVYPLAEIPHDIGALTRLALFHAAEKTMGKLAGLLDDFRSQPLRETLSLEVAR